MHAGLKAFALQATAAAIYIAVAVHAAFAAAEVSDELKADFEQRLRAVLADEKKSLSSLRHLEGTTEEDRKEQEEDDKMGPLAELRAAAKTLSVKFTAADPEMSEPDVMDGFWVRPNLPPVSMGLLEWSKGGFSSSYGFPLGLKEGELWMISIVREKIPNPGAPDSSFNIDFTFPSQSADWACEVIVRFVASNIPRVHKAKTMNPSTGNLFTVLRGQRIESISVTPLAGSAQTRATIQKMTVKEDAPPVVEQTVEVPVADLKAPSEAVLIFRANP